MAPAWWPLLGWSRPKCAGVCQVNGPRPGSSKVVVVGRSRSGTSPTRTCRGARVGGGPSRLLSPTRGAYPVTPLTHIHKSTKTTPPPLLHPTHPLPPYSAIRTLICTPSLPPSVCTHSIPPQTHRNHSLNSMTSLRTAGKL